MPCILVVEDDANQRILYRQEFEDCGYTVTAVTDATEAWVYLHRHNPDILILDLSIPRLEDGLAFLHRLRRTFHKLPVVVNTGCNPDLVRWRCCKPEHVVTKSSDLRILLDKVESLLPGGKHTTRPASIAIDP